MFHFGWGKDNWFSFLKRKKKLYMKITSYTYNYYYSVHIRISKMQVCTYAITHFINQTKNIKPQSKLSKSNLSAALLSPVIV